MSFRMIKFRGKNKSSQWVYGAFIPPEFSSWYEPSIFDGHHRSEVDGETLGQYTGHVDVDGNEIYENDIVEIVISGIEGRHETFRNVVKYFMGTWEISASEDVAYNFYYLMIMEFVKAKVLGNIHDNPELLEEKK